MESGEVDALIDSRAESFERHIKILLGRRILGVKCRGDHLRDENGNVSFYKTEKTLDRTNWVRVIMVSSKCRNLTVGDFEKMNRTHKVFMVFPEYARKGFERLVGDLWLIDERLMDESNPSLKPFIQLEPRD
jgi:hypothetical protein